VIEVTGKIEDDQVVYSVRDNGAGFPTWLITTIYSKYSRLHTDVESDGSG
jgi:light-regulated signal transduction histidine kinase (bacteriophytochrome)